MNGKQESRGESKAEMVGKQGESAYMQQAAAPPPYSKATTATSGSQISTKTFEVLRPTFSKHYSVTSKTDGKFHIDVSTWSPDKPALTMHVGTDTGGPVVAVSRFPKFSSRCRIGLGDYTKNPRDVMWEEMRGSSHDWSMAIDNVRRAFMWKRTSSEGINGRPPAGFTRNWKLVDSRSNTVVAVFAPTHGFSNVGDLQIRASYGDDFDRMVIITYISIDEKRRRSSSGGGGGGGGGGA